MHRYKYLILWANAKGSLSRCRLLVFAILITHGLNCTGSCQAAESLTASVDQVKAAYIINFPKYVDWPTEAFAETNSPIVIAVLGNTKVTGEMEKVIAGRTINGRPLIIKQVTATELAGCHILFISSSEKSQMDEILAKAGSLPILTVGEHEQFLKKGGTINFTQKDSRIRLEINLTAAHQAKVQISSKLLSVADVVKGKSN